MEETADPEADLQAIIVEYGEQLEQKLWATLVADANIAQVAGRWFPRALLMDINPGHLNLAEAVLEMAGGDTRGRRQLGDRHAPIARQRHGHRTHGQQQRQLMRRRTAATGRPDRRPEMSSPPEQRQAA